MADVRVGPPLFRPRNPIEVLLVKAADAPDARKAFETELMVTELLACTPERPAAQQTQRVLSQDEQVALLNIPSPDGKGNVVALFTSQDRIVDCFGLGTGFIQMAGGLLLGMVEQHGAVLNPGSAYAVFWSPEQIKGLLDSRLKGAAVKG
jgi:SseB protein N-terminal domain